jgi:perosamine synthetase
VDKAKRDAILKRRALSALWGGEPGLGGWYTEDEFEAVIQTVRNSMNPAEGFGFICEEIVEFESKFAAYTDVAHAISITSAGAGLDMAMMCLDIQPGDEVMAAAVNFPGALFAPLGQGAKLVLCEVDPRTLCIDPVDVERRITPRTRAILATHMNGLSADIDALEAVCARHPHPKYGPAKVITDAARAGGCEYKGTKVGKRGWMTIHSFHTMKLMTTLGEGGMITTDDPAVAQRLRGLRQWGSGLGDLEHPEGPEAAAADYRWGWGTNYKMTKVQAAVGIVQLRRLDEMIDARVALAEARTEMLAGVPQLITPWVPPGYKHVFYLYSLLVAPEWAGEKRDRLMALLRDDYGVPTVVANPPNYLSSPYIRRHTAGQTLPVSEDIGRRLFCPGLHPLMSAEDSEYIAAAIMDAVERVAAEG